MHASQLSLRKLAASHVKALITQIASKKMPEMVLVA